MKKTIYILLLAVLVSVPAVSLAKTDSKISAYDKKIEVLMQKISVLKKQLDEVTALREKRVAQLIGKGADVSSVSLSAQHTTVKLRTSDHIRGNPKAPIVLIEYSDLECPFCKMYHETMNKIMTKYEKSSRRTRS